MLMRALEHFAPAVLRSGVVTVALFGATAGTGLYVGCVTKRCRIDKETRTHSS